MNSLLYMSYIKDVVNGTFLIRRFGIWIIKKEQKTYGGLFDPDTKEKQIKKLEEEIDQPNFWNDKRKSEKKISELNDFKNKRIKD